MTVEKNCSTCGYTCTESMHYKGCYGMEKHLFWMPKVAKVSDNVNHPSHYADGKIECIDAMEEVCAGLQGMEALCTGNVLKYLWRWKKKNGLEDLRKAKWYLERLIKTLEGGDR